ncbi:MAG: hypothetical protein V1681_05420 [Candidatus Neomarinimicrobiota bacterium]
MPRNCQGEIVSDYLITGMGMDNVRRRLEERVKQMEYLAIVNIGTAGAIAPELSPSMVIFPFEFCCLDNSHIHSIRQSNRLIPGITWPVSWKRGRLFSSRTAVSSLDERQAIQVQCQADAVDMEAYAAAEFCERRAIPFACLKVITDLADTNSRAEFKKNLSQAARILADNVPILVDNLRRNFESGANNG